MPFEPFTLAGLALRNRVIKAATFEGMSPDGEVTPALVRHHRDVTAGGAAMTTVAYCAVGPDGRTFRDQLHMRPAIVPGLRGLTDAVHREGAAASLLLGHCGSFCNNHALVRRRPFGPSPALNLLGALSGRPLPDAMTVAEIAEVTGQFVAAARLAREAGFDAVELHLGHGYLLSQFLSPATNRRTDDYGGSPAARARFPLAVVARVREALPAAFPVLAKVHLRAGSPGGFELADCVAQARVQQAAGADALVLSGGFVSRDAFYLLGIITFGMDKTSTITGITKASQAVISTTGGPYFVTESAHISGVVGMTEINGKRGVITSVNPGVSITVNIDTSSGYRTYVSGGTLNLNPQTGESVTAGCYFD